ncbi:Bug family tripartite tricarboxylate transporter substrate binding protein [Bordetella trematum]|uniref:Bug family tripartite tricarboxylate transporter substrate binding protein n=1 Tax=Bordetella trematum TaxID=123899 RepID=UPI003AF3DC5B
MSEMHRRPGAMRKGLSRLQCAVLIALGALSLAGAARAEDPAIRIVVSLPAGGGVDVMARYLAQQLGKELQRSVVVENRPGGSGTIAARAVMNAPEGQTTLLAGGTRKSPLRRICSKMRTTGRWSPWCRCCKSAWCRRSWSPRLEPTPDPTPCCKA